MELFWLVGLCYSFGVDPRVDTIAKQSVILLFIWFILVDISTVLLLGPFALSIIILTFSV